MKAVKLPSGSYRAQAYDKYTKKRKSFTAPSKKEAERQANLWLLTMRKPASITFGEALDLYIAGREHTLSPTTITSYKSYRRLYYDDLLPMPIDDITDGMLQFFVDRVSAGTRRPRSPHTVMNIWCPVSTIIRAYSPGRVLNVKLPGKVKADIYIPTEEEVRTLISAAEGNEIQLPILLAAFCTLRRGEVSALMAEDVINGEIHVKSSLAKAGDRWIRKSPKTYAGSRYIACPQSIAEMLPATGPVTPLNPGVITHRFQRLVERTGVHPMHFHALRHYCASQMIAHGIPISEVKRMGGWDSKALEQIYMHSLEDHRRKNDAIMTGIADDFLKNCTQTAHEQNKKPLK